MLSVESATVAGFSFFFSSTIHRTLANNITWKLIFFLLWFSICSSILILLRMSVFFCSPVMQREFIINSQQRQEERNLHLTWMGRQTRAYTLICSCLSEIGVNLRAWAYAHAGREHLSVQVLNEMRPTVHRPFVAFISSSSSSSLLQLTSCPNILPRINPSTSTEEALRMNAYTQITHTAAIHLPINLHKHVYIIIIIFIYR